MAIETERGFGSRIEGVIGLWSWTYDETDPAMQLYPKTLVQKFHEDGVISEGCFSFYLSAEDKQSYIDFGTPNEKVYTV